MDVHSPKQRSFNMSRIRSRDTKPELMVRKWLWSHGYRYRLHCRDLPGKPDIVFRGRNKVIFVHGCFWHRHNCKYFKWPESNAEFWQQKIEGNVLRDQANFHLLIASGWVYLILWECAFRNLKRVDRYERVEYLGQYIEQFLSGENSRCLEIDADGARFQVQADIPKAPETR
jgi:DNA mismatch endonuclease (patch repair protein)